MCTVVCRWSPGEQFPVELLALRDERRSRTFDLPANWWPEVPQAIGGRDRQAGGSWCISSVEAGVTAVVLNRPDRPDADPGATSRGVLPLLAIEHGAQWPRHIALAGMASFNLVLAGPRALRWWWFDGDRLDRVDLPAGSHLFKPRGLVTDDVDPQLLTGRARLDDLDAPTRIAWGEWLAILDASVPTEDPGGLLVRKTLDDGEIYETVFAQFIAARPGTLRLDHLVDPIGAGEWAQTLIRP